MARRLVRGGHEVVVSNRSPEPVEQLEADGAVGAHSLGELVERLKAPRAVWVSLPAGGVTENTLNQLAPLLTRGDVIVESGNSSYKDTIRCAAQLKESGLDLLDQGTSGGVWGLERGYCLMIGGAADPVRRLDPIFATLAPGVGDVPRTAGRERVPGTVEQGYLHCGPSGSGHFVKMVHNGIEYGVMQAYAEGFDILLNARSEDLPEELRYRLHVSDIAELWRRGSVIGSWLLDLTALALVEDPSLQSYTGSVQDSGEGRWTVMAAIEEGVPAAVLSAALYVRFRSRQDHSFAEKVLSAMRHKFGGHVERPSGG